MRGLRIAGLIGLLLGAGVLPVLADEATVQALGDTYLVLEDETTVLSLFNLGNPAGAAFLPHQNRLDASLRAGQTTEVSEFTTRPERDFFGNTLPTNADPFGNTLPPNTVFSYKEGRWSLQLNQWDTAGYGGFLTWLTPDVVLQLDPQGGEKTISSTDNASGSKNYGAGGRVRGACLLGPDLSVGVGVTGWRGRTSSWAGGAFAEWLNGFSPTSNVFSSAMDSDYRSLGAEVGAAARWAAVFAPDDLLTTGLTVTGGQQVDEHSLSLNELATGSGWFGRLVSTAWPFSFALHGVYNYRGVMDVGLETGYRTEEQSLSWDTNLPGLADRSGVLSGDVHNLLYGLSFRVRLPMIREDDLRFGVQFDNRGVGHPYPTGELQLINLANQRLAPVITTGSSAIGIGVSVVPAEDSIIALQYRLGSSKTRQAGILLANSGFNQFGLGGQYTIQEGLALRFGYTNERIAYEERLAPTMLLQTLITTTATLRAGIGISDGPLSFNLAVMLTRVTHSPMGWDFPGKPSTVKEVNQDLEDGVAAHVGVTWLY
jgi:hypothetical protein